MDDTQKKIDADDLIYAFDERDLAAIANCLREMKEVDASVLAILADYFDPKDVNGSEDYRLVFRKRNNGRPKKSMAEQARPLHTYWAVIEIEKKLHEADINKYGKKQKRKTQAIAIYAQRSGRSLSSVKGDLKDAQGRLSNK